MSFNRLNYDTCAYKQTLSESIGPCEYQLGTPQTTCEPCLSKDPRSRIQKNGISLASRMKNIDTDSELLNITRDLSNCSQKKHLPTFNSDNSIQTSDKLLPFIECPNLVTEDTKLSNPPCTLRGTGWNRWEWLCLDPQERVLPPFDYGVSTRLVARDNHRPYIPRPGNQSACLPQPTNAPIETQIAKVPSVPTSPPSVQWRSAEEIRQY